MTSDGHQIRETWANALNSALATFRAHLTSIQSSSWKRVPLPLRKNSSGNGRARVLSGPRPDSRDVAVFRKATKTGDLYRIILDLPATEDIIDLEAWKAALVTPELRQEWDPAVESAHILEMYDPSTRIVKTNFTLGWPANPRDAVMISRTFYDATTLVDVSTSLPRSQDEPSYLRPSPPYVRSHVNLFAWCIQLISPEGKPRLVRMVGFWQHDLKTIWNIGVPINMPQQLSTMTMGLLDTVKKRQLRVPYLAAYGFGVSIERVAFDIGRAALTIDYAIIPEDSGSALNLITMHDLDDLYAVKEQRLLQRTLEVLLPSPDGWDIRVATRASSEELAQLPWSTSASKCDSSKISFQIRHTPLIDDHSVLKVKLIVEFSAALKGVRVNGLPHSFEKRIDRELKLFTGSKQLLQDASSVAHASINSANASIATTESDASANSSMQMPSLSRTDSSASVVARGPAFEKTILTRVRRNYIYFSSLLQEPEAKWKRNSDVRGVSVTQLDSIDPTLVVYKAEATFVGVGLWDLYSAIVTPGTRMHWDRQFDDANLLEDVNELSELWHYKTKPAWPVTGRDCVLLKTVYKSPTTVHVFSFSIDDHRLFPELPPVDAGTIRTQVDLQGWAIEALSPTTTQLTLLEQSDPKGWTGKATVPQQMIAGVAGVGEFAIKYGGPPVVTRLTGARSTSQRYEHERGIFRVEYEPAASRSPSLPVDDTAQSSRMRQSSMDSMQTLGPETCINVEQTASDTSIECELRCDIDTWASSLDIVIDPPPQSISCLRRHRLSAGGGGSWLTIGHDISFDSEERLQAIVRRAPVTTAKERGIVMVNGKRIDVDVEELPETEMKSLAKQKRIKPVRVPLDQPPVMGVIRRRRAELEDGDLSDTSPDSCPSLVRTGRSGSQSIPTSSVPKVPSPLSTFFTTAMEQVTTTTQHAVAALVPPTALMTNAGFPVGKRPMHYALDALAFVQAYSRGACRDNWTTVSDGGVLIQKRVSPEISPNVPLCRGEKVIEGVTADEVATVVYSYDCRKQWDERFESVSILEEYGADCHTAFLVSKTGFPFRNRGLLLSSIKAREDKHVTLGTPSLGAGPVQSPGGSSSVIYCVSASFDPASATSLVSAKYNPYSLPIGRIYIDAWILETLDPYTAENYAIPSTRCTRLAAADFSGSVPAAFNSMINASLPRTIVNVESYMKSATPFPELRSPSASFRLARAVPEAEEYVWTLADGTQDSTLLSSKLGVSDKLFTATLLVSFRRHTPNLQDIENEDEKIESVQGERLSRSQSPNNLDRQRDERKESLSPSRRRRDSRSTSAEVISSELSVGKSHSRERTRTSSSAFSIGRDQRSRDPADLCVAEVIIDLRTYPDGYEVQLLSHIEPFDFVHPARLTRDAKPSVSSNMLPIMHSTIVLPPSSLYTSGANTDMPERHLLRLTLPTSQFELPSVVDPLTGETRSAPPKAQWYTDLESKNKRAMVEVSVMSLPSDKRRKGKKVVMIDGISVSVSSEKDALKSSISESSGGILRRVQIREGQSVFSLPERLVSPYGVDGSFLEVDSTASNGDKGLVQTVQSDQLAGEHITTMDDIEVGTPSTNGQTTPIDAKEISPSVESNRKFLGFISSYQNPLNYLGFTSGLASRSVARTSSSYPTPAPTPPPALTEAPDSPRPDQKFDLRTNSNAVTSSALAVVRSARIPRFSISTLIACMLIAFLLGSLLRSLLSPADFIYVVTDLGDVPEGVTRSSSGALGAIEPGWREIKRIVEMKYIVGGWDFQIAVVRRH